MKKRFLYFLLVFIAPAFVHAQTNPQPSMNLPKDAPVDVSIEDMKNNPLSNEIVVFKSKANGTEYQGLSDSTGKFSLRLPSGDKYEIFILGFHDSTSYTTFEIPALKGNSYYKNAQMIDIQFEAPKTFILDNCNFETGKATLQPESYKVIDDLVDYMNRKDDEKIEIGGHTDNVGSAAANMKLSLDRANAVRDYLISKGISADRLTAKGYGMTMPIADNSTAEGRAQNRRTEVTILE